MDRNFLANGSMAEQITSLYESVFKILDTHCKLNFYAMNSMHAMNYNGFKRWHRYRIRQFEELKICLTNSVYDKFRIKPVVKSYEFNYSPSDIEEHLKSWDSVLLEDIKKLGEINKDYFEITGTESEIVKTSLKKMTRDFEKVGRLLKRFADSNWSAVDINIVDDKLHCKYKEKENALGFRY